jgi:dihydroorotate dehydrogenase
MAEFAGYDIEVPFGPAAGVVNGASRELFVHHMRQVLRSAAGFGLGGTTTKNGGEGNAHFGRTYYHNPLTGETVNSMGLPSIGIEGIEEVYPELRKFADDKGKPLGVSVASAMGEDPVKVFPELIERSFLAGAVFVEANYSCPNQITEDGKREPILSYDYLMVRRVREAILERLGTDQFWGEKWSPAVGERVGVIRRLAASLWDTEGIYYVAGPNAIPGQELHDEDGKPALDVPGNKGGLSGPVTRALGREAAEKLRSALPPRMKLVSCLGVDSGNEVYMRVNRLGADLAAGVTIYFENERRVIDYGETATLVAEEYAEAAASDNW